jgi:capsular biosynthesis protein
MNEKVTIIIATHKKYQMPDDKMYMPVHVGAEGKTDEKGNPLYLGYVKDNTGENISKKNASFCELTGLYWAWKNLDSEYIGLAHYRRHFSLSKKTKNPFDNILSYRELYPLTKKYKVFVPKKRKYYIETLYSHYAHTHYAEHLDVTKRIISEKYPEYLASCEKIYKQRSGFMFNMMIMEKKLFNDYCGWLFDILFELEKRIGSTSSELSFFQGRFYGRVSEIIFNVWLDYKISTGVIKKNDVKEIPCIYTEKINWNRKIRSFIGAKFGHKKYEGSF